MSHSTDSSRAVDVASIIEPGATIAGKYRVERKLGAGGMGVVVAARHVQLNQLVAIKFLHPEADPGGTVASRFLREARAAAALRSEHVARVYDVGTLESGEPYMVMEYLEGASLSKVIRVRAPMPVAEAVDLMLQACKAMEEAHALGIVHRDIKPGNMFLARRPDGTNVLKVLDFGISKFTSKLDDEADPTLTASQMMLGSPKYFSPEQVTDAKNVDHRADVWALGLVLYYMLGGRRPFEADTLSAVCVAIATETPPRLSDLRPEIPRELDIAVMGCLEKDRERRTQSASEFARAIAPFGSGTVVALPGAIEHVMAPAVVPLGRASQESLPGTAPLADDAPFAPLSQPSIDDRSIGAAVAPARPRVPMVWIQAGAGGVVVGVLLWVLLAGGSDPAPPPMGAVVPVSSEVPSAAPAEAPPKPQERSVIVPGSAKPVQATRRTDAPKDMTHLLEANALGTTQATLRLLDGVGSQRVIGVVPKGEIVMIKRVVGEWALVTYVDEGRVVSGWTIRNLIQ